MRFISPYRQYKVFAIHPKQVRLADGTYNILEPGYTAEWTPFDVTDWEREEARKRFHYKGSVKDTSGRELDPIDEEHRVAVFDTADIADEKLRKRVEAALLSRPGYGTDFILVEKPKLPAPWPAYDQLVVHGQRKIDHVAAKIAEQVREGGYSPEQVVAYERENLNRPEVIAAVEQLLPAPDPEDDLIAA